MSTRYKIRSPIDIWTAYGGDQQRIAQAMQLGVIRPEEGVLAVMEGKRKPPPPVAQGTVAQQVMGIVPPPTNPMAPNMGAPAPQPAPPMQAPMGAPMGAPPMPGMAMGGVASLPIPGAMFDEPDNGGYGDGYAGGGLVAFADGGPTGGWGDYIEQVVRSLDPNIEISGRARTPARNAEVGGVAGSYHIIDAARDIRTPEGMDKNEFIAQLKSVFGPDYDILPSKGRSVHIEPGPKLGEKVRAGTRPSNMPATMPERDFGTAEGRAGSFSDVFNMLRDQFGPSEESKKIDERRRARAEEMASDEYYERQRKDSVNNTLTALGFNMASSKSPYFFQALGEAGAAAAPGATADKKERKALQDRALDIMGQMNDKTRKENLELLAPTIDIINSGVKQEQFEEELRFRRSEGELDRAAQIEAQKIAAAGKTSDLESTAAIIFNGLLVSNKQGLLKKDGKPYKFADEALRVKAIHEAAKLLGKDKPPAAGLSPFGALQPTGSQQEVVNLGTIE